MKKIRLLIVMVAALLSVLSSCSKSPEQKVKDLVVPEIKSQLLIPESLDIAGIKLDSAYAPYDSPEFITLSMKLIKMAHEFDEVLASEREAREDCAIYSNPYGDLSKYKLSEAKAALNKALANKHKLESQTKTFCKEAMMLKVKTPKFIGYKAIVSFRSKNNYGVVFMNYYYVVFDKKIEKIMCMIGDGDYEQYQEFWKNVQQ